MIIIEICFKKTILRYNILILERMMEITQVLKKDKSKI